MESDSQSSNEDNCSSSDSCSDMDVDNTEEHKEQSISKQEQIDIKTFSYYSHYSHYSHNDQNIIMLLKYTKQGTFIVWKKNQDCLWSFQDILNLLKTTKKQSRSIRKIEAERKYILSEVDKNGSLSAILNTI